jgi:hypothetical protein
MHWAPSSGAVVTVRFIFSVVCALSVRIQHISVHLFVFHAFSELHSRVLVQLACAVSVLLQHRICRARALQESEPWQDH